MFYTERDDRLKIGVVDVGGGLRGGYAAGVFDRLTEENIYFDVCIGVSAGSANCASFLAGQKGRNYPFYTDKKITFNVFMSQPQSNEELDGYPVFEVYQGFAENVPYINLYKDDHSVVINGIEKSFEKRFTLDDLSFLRASSYDEDVFERHGEKVTLDLSGFEVNEAVTVTLHTDTFSDMTALELFKVDRGHRLRIGPECADHYFNRSHR